MVLLTAMAIIATGCTKPDDLNSGSGGNNGGSDNEGGNNGGGHYNGNYEYVDLGLPSGTLWATFNVGAEKPEDYGDYFAWAETQPKTVYSWSTYKYSNGGDENNPNLIKYSTSSNYYGYNGFVDGLSTLLREDDAATANWGNEWCTPTIEQWNELRLNSTQTNTTQNGVYGTLCTASNGNSIFLPAAGYLLDDISLYPGVNGFYWANSLIQNYPQNALQTTWGQWNDGSSGAYFRRSGLSVRPVRYTNNNGGGNNGGGNEGGELLTVTDFEWYKYGSSTSGLEEYGLYWQGNYKDVNAHIKPLDGVTLFSFNSSTWDATITNSEKAALFANDGQIIDLYHNVSVMYYNSTYDDVIGTKMPDGTLHLIHVTNCTVGESNPPYGFSYHIYGQSK